MICAWVRELCGVWEASLAALLTVEGLGMLVIVLSVDCLKFTTPFFFVRREIMRVGAGVGSKVVVSVERRRQILQNDRRKKVGCVVRTKS